MIDLAILEDQALKRSSSTTLPPSYGYTYDAVGKRKVCAVGSVSALMSSKRTKNEFKKDTVQASWNFIRAYGTMKASEMYWNGKCILDIAGDSLKYDN